MPVNKYIPKNIRKLYLIVCAYYTWCLSKAQVCQVVSKLFFHFGANCVEVVFLKTVFHFWTNCPEVAFTKAFRMNEQPSLQNDVRRGLGMLPQRAIFAKAPKGDCVKMSEPVQVYTACQFVKGQNIALNYFQLGNNFATTPVANSSTSQNHFLHFWTCAQLGYKWI